MSDIQNNEIGHKGKDNKDNLFEFDPDIYNSIINFYNSLVFGVIVASFDDT